MHWGSPDWHLVLILPLSFWVLLYRDYRWAQGVCQGCQPCSVCGSPRLQLLRISAASLANGNDTVTTPFPSMPYLTLEQPGSWSVIYIFVYTNEKVRQKDFVPNKGQYLEIMDDWELCLWILKCIYTQSLFFNMFGIILLYTVFYGQLIFVTMLQTFLPGNPAKNNTSYFRLPTISHCLAICSSDVYLLCAPLQLAIGLPSWYPW